MPKVTKEQPTELLDDEEMLAINSTLFLETLQLKKLRWQAKITVRTTLPRSYRAYKIELELDDAPYLERIQELEEEFDATLFKDDKSSKKAHQDKVREMRDQLTRMRDETELIKFTAIVDELKYKSNETTLLMQIPDDVIEPFNRQKTRFDIYKITLTPII